MMSLFVARQEKVNTHLLQRKFRLIVFIRYIQLLIGKNTRSVESQILIESYILHRSFLVIAKCDRISYIALTYMN